MKINARLILLIILALALISVHSDVLFAQMLIAARANVVVGSLKTAGKKAESLGSCFLVDKRGYFATSFTNLREASAATIMLSEGFACTVSGVVAASKGKDVVILAVRDFPKGREPVLLMSEAELETGMVVMPWGGPLSRAAESHFLRPSGWEPSSGLPILFMPHIGQPLRGDEYLLTLPVLVNDAAGTDADAQWFLIDQARDRSCCGGPVFDSKGQVLGMLSGALTAGNAVYSAIHAKHIQEIIPDDTHKPLPLTSLKQWQDPLSLPAKEPETKGDKHVAGKYKHGLPLAERFRDLQERSTNVEKLKATMEKLIADRKAGAVEMATELDKIRVGMETMQPEETRTETQTIRTRETDRDSKDFGKTKETEIERTVRVFSSRQQLLRQTAGARHYELRSELMQAEIRNRFETEVGRPAFSRMEGHIGDELFYTADPFALRSAEEHEQLILALNQAIEDGGASAALYGARAMTLIHLDKFETVAADLKEMLDIDARQKPVVLAMEAYKNMKVGNAKDGVKQIGDAQRLSKKDARVLFLMAVVELRNGEEDDALRALNLAAENGADPVEVNLAQAWISATSPEVPTSKLRLATLAAQQACSQTARRDWNCLAALAACYSRANDELNALNAIESAIEVAPESAQVRCQEWKRLILAKEAIPSFWK